MPLSPASCMATPTAGTGIAARASATPPAQSWLHATPAPTICPTSLKHWPLWRPPAGSSTEARLRIGLFTDSLQDLSLADALEWMASHGLEAVEIGTGNFSPAPHCDVNRLVEGGRAADEFKAAIEAHGLV